jgi:single-stranded-DNA-specific exonuclease
MYDWEIQSQSFSFTDIKRNLLQNSLGDFSEEEFFNPPQPVKLLNSRFFENYFFDSIKMAKEIIFSAISENKLILIHGDYDADGVCATSILYQTIKNTLNYQNCLTLIPDRFEDGYGLSDKTVQKLLDLAFNSNFLLITVDCGITSVSQVNYLKNLGCSIIITDHHHAGNEKPNADVIVWSDKVVGSTISWLLSLGLGNKDPQVMCLSSIATVTDVFPLVGFNRSLVKHGLSVLKTTPPISIETILDLNNKNIKQITTYDLGFVIGPRLNSSGRIGSADTSLELLNSENREQAKFYVNILNEVNTKRQKITEDSLNEVEIDSNALPKILIIYKDKFHEGVMGLIASRLVHKFNRPVLVLSSNEGNYKGSARSVKGINIIEILKVYKEDFISVGGHELAAGFSLKPGNFENLKTKLLDHMDKFYKEFNFNKKLKVTTELNIDLIKFELTDLLDNMEPFGTGNEEPLFCSRDLIVKDLKFLGEKKNHLSLLLENQNKIIKGMFFNFDKEVYDIFLGVKLDLVYKVRKNEYKGNFNVELNIVDIKIKND